MKAELPNYLEFNVVLGPGTPVSELLDFVNRLAKERRDFNPVSWRLIDELRAEETAGESKRKGAPTAADLENLGAEAFANGFTIDGKTGGLTVQNLALLSGGGGERDTYGLTEGWRLFDVNFTFDGKGEKAFLAALELQVGIVRACLERLPVVRAHIFRDSDSFVGPIPPHAPPDVLLYTPLTEEIDRDYADANAYWRGWDAVEYLSGGKALVTRALDVVDETAFKKQAMEGGFAMARGARPGLAKYYEPDPSDEEEEMLEELEGYLEQVGYDAAEQTLEFSAVVPADDHLTPADIFLIIGYLENGTGDGDEVGAVRVTFPDKASAEREAPVLRDIGVTIQYFGEDGAWKEL